MSLQTETQDLGLSQGTRHAFRVARVNLLPPEIEQSRQLRRLQVGLAGGLVGVVVVAGAAFGLAVQSKQQAQQDLTAAQAETVRLKAQQEPYADVPTTIAKIDAAEGARSTAMARDVEWYRSLNDFALTLPSNVWFTSLGLTLTGAAGSATPAGATTPAPVTGTTPATGEAATAAIGTVVVNGSAMDHPDVATWLDVLGRRPGLQDAYFTNSAKTKVGSKSIVNFISTATITDAALSHRYDRKQG